jgi:hypothetical protein
VKRREFMRLLGGAAVMWPGAASAQLAMPAIGVLDSRLPDAITDRLRADFARASKTPATSRGRTWRLYTALLRIEMTGCRSWQPIWFAVALP